VANITIDPSEFILVGFVADEIAAIAERIATAVGFPTDQKIEINVEESTPLFRVLLTSVNPVTIEVEGGAFEDPKRPRQLSAAKTEAALARVLFQAHDRVLGGFADAPLQGLTLAQQIAWDTNSLGRSDRLGVKFAKQPHLYAFRNRHGFSDASDAVFERLWNADALTWADVLAACAETDAAAANS
jgi:hypothetical protein